MRSLVGFEVVHFLFDVLYQAGMSRFWAAERGDYLFDLSLIQLVLPHHDPALPRGLILGIDFARQDPEMLPTVILIDDKGGIGEVQAA